MFTYCLDFLVAYWSLYCTLLFSESSCPPWTAPARPKQVRIPLFLNSIFELQKLTLQKSIQCIKNDAISRNFTVTHACNSCAKMVMKQMPSSCFEFKSSINKEVC